MWKKIIINGEETNYSVSSEGQVRNDKFNRLLKGSLKTNEYHVVQLSIKGQTRGFMIHRLVAEAFCENPNNYNIVDHIDHNKHNNNYTNLRWVTSKENSLNALKPAHNAKREYFTEEFDENWKPVFCDNRYMINKQGQVVNKIQKNYLVPLDRNGYKRVNLLSGRKSVHILVWETFNNQKVPSGYQIDHIDGNKSNNVLSNLRLVTSSENMRNAYFNGHENQIEVYQYNKNGQFIQKYNTIQEAANAMNVTHAAIRSAIVRKGTCNNYYWLLKDMNIDEILVSWIPNGYKQLKNYPTYCINEKGQVYNKRNKRHVPVHYRADGVTEYIIIKSKRLNVQDLLKEETL